MLAPAANNYLDTLNPEQRRADISTGCASSEIAKAEQRLKEYLADKHSPVRKLQDIERIAIGDVLSIFVDDRPDLYATSSGAAQYRGRMVRLNEYWGAKMLSDVSGETCRAYHRFRGNDMRRWCDRDLIGTHFVEFNGAPVASVKTAFARAVFLADLPGQVSPHTLRHTAATWLMQNGADRWQAAGYLGMSVEMLEKVYGHHHPDYLQDAVAAISRRRSNKS